MLNVSFSGGAAARADEAAELYVKAGNSFKMAKKWTGRSTYAKNYADFALIHFMLELRNC